MYAGRQRLVLPLVSHGVYADGTDRQTDGRTPDHYIMLSARRGQRKNTNDGIHYVACTLSGALYAFSVPV